MELKINNLTKTYGDQTVLNIPDTTIHAGEIIGLVGNNGAGKTTLFRLMLDLIPATTGEVLSNGKPVNETEEWKLYTGSFIDGRFLIDFYTAEEYFSFICGVYKISKDEMQQRLANYEKLMHAEILGNKKQLKSFSSGNRQKVGIIGAMLIHPDVLILDEPFNYLDPSSQILVARLIKEMNEKLGTTVLISSHNLTFVSEISTRILLLDKGVLIKDLPNENGSATDELKEYFEEGAKIE